MTSTVSCKEKPEEFKKNDFYFLVIQEDEKLSAVRKVPETIVFQALGSFGTLDPKLSHGTSFDIFYLASKPSATASAKFSSTMLAQWSQIVA